MQENPSNKAVHFEISLIVSITTRAIFSSILVNFDCIHGVYRWNFDNVVHMCSTTVQFVPLLGWHISTVDPDTVTLPLQSIPRIKLPFSCFG